MIKSDIVKALSVFTDGARVVIPGPPDGPKFLDIKTITFDQQDDKFVVVLIPEEVVTQASSPNTAVQSSHPDAMNAYCDGSCLGNPGPGGWAYVIDMTPISPMIKEAGGAEHTTNNVMELEAAIKCLKRCIILRNWSDLDIVIYTDSEYVSKTVSGEYNGKANASLISELRTLMNNPHIRFEWRARNSIPQMEDCDALAKAAARNYLACI